MHKVKVLGIEREKNCTKNSQFEKNNERNGNILLDFLIKMRNLSLTETFNAYAHTQPS